MAPTLRHGDVLLVRWRPRTPPRPGAVVVVDLPDRPLAVKRVARVGSGGQIWVEGDNALASTDSRILGGLPPQAVRGLVICRIWPKPGYVRPSH